MLLSLGMEVSQQSEQKAVPFQLYKQAESMLGAAP